MDMHEALPAAVCELTRSLCTDAPGGGHKISQEASQAKVQHGMPLICL